MDDSNPLDSERTSGSGLACRAYAERLTELSAMWIAQDEPTGITDTTRASRPSPPPPLAVGSEVNGRYRIEAVLGAGGMGRVYGVRDGLYPNRPTALKTVLSNVDAKTASLFRAEFQAMASLGHPGIARVYDFERIVGSAEFFFTMELLNGSDIKRVIGSGDWARTVHLLIQVAHALDYIHRHNIVHLDLKPSNVLVTLDGAGAERVKVLDFGIAGMKQSHGIFGTLMYMAPELMHGMVPDRRADIYALGVMAFELLSGKRPYEDTGSAAALLETKSTRPIAFPADVDVPAWLCAVVERMGAIDPARRQASAMEVARQLEEGAASGSAARGAESAAPAVSSSRFVGRTRELEAIVEHVQARLRRVAGDEDGSPCLFVSGGRGLGKSRLLREVRHLLQLDGIVVLSGDAFADDLAEYTPIVPVMLAAAGVAHANAAAPLIDEHGPEIVKLAPGFGAAQSVVSSPALVNALAERRRILRAAADFLLALSSRVGLVVCFHDLQWASRSSIDVLTMVLDRMAEFPAARLAILGSYRSDGVAGTPLEGFLRVSRTTRPHRAVVLAPLDAFETESVIVSMLGTEASPDLVRSLYVASGGAPFLLEQAVRNAVLSDELVSRGGTLYRCEPSSRSSETGGAVLSGLARLDPTDRTLVDLLAACGRPVAPEILRRAAVMSYDDVVSRLRFLEEQQLVVLLAGKDSRYGLANDSIREAVSAATSAEAMEALHARLGAAYTETLADHDAGEHLLSAAAQWMTAGGPEDTDQGIVRAEVAVRAARAANASTAFSQALRYLDAAAAWLPSTKWERCRALALELEELRADACISEARLDEAEEAGLHLEHYATETLQRARGRRIWMTCQLSRGQVSTVIDSGIGLARQLGEHMPKNPNLVHALSAIRRLRRQLSPEVLQRLATLPQMSDPRALEFDKCFAELYLAAYLGRPKLLPVVVEAAMRQIMAHGLSPSSARVVGAVGMLMAAVGDIPRAFAMAEAAEQLLPHTHRSAQGSARYAYTGGVRHLRDPFREIRADLLMIRGECLDVGDHIFAGMACVSVSALDVCTGVPLGVTEKFIQDPQTRQLLDASALTRRMQRVIRHATHHLQDGIEGLLSKSTYFDTADLDDQLGRSTQAYYRLLLEATYRLPASRGTRSIGVPLTIERIWAGTVFVAETYFSWTLCAINTARAGLPVWRRLTVGSEIGIIRRRLRRMAVRCPVNHGHRIALVDAEWRRYKGRTSDAVPLYAEAIALADDAHDLRIGGLARELMAEASLELGHPEDAKRYILEARERYREWNAPGVVVALERRYASVLN